MFIETDLSEYTPELETRLRTLISNVLSFTTYISFLYPAHYRSVPLSQIISLRNSDSKYNELWVRFDEYKTRYSVTSSQNLIAELNSLITNKTDINNATTNKVIQYENKFLLSNKSSIFSTALSEIGVLASNIESYFILNYKIENGIIKKITDILPSTQVLTNAPSVPSQPSTSYTVPSSGFVSGDTPPNIDTDSLKTDSLPVPELIPPVNMFSDMINKITGNPIVSIAIGLTGIKLIMFLMQMKHKKAR